MALVPCQLRTASVSIITARLKMMTASPPSTYTSLVGEQASTSAALRGLLHETYTRLASDDIGTMDDFVIGLNEARQRMSVSDWRQHVSEIFRTHPIRSLIHEEPFTRRAFEKPRGYAGDAPLLDLIYRDTPCTDDLSPLGARLHSWAGMQPACRSVQERRTILARLIDQVASERPMPRLLSLACGHLREAQCCHAVQAGLIEEFVAVDQDAESIAVVEREQRAFKVTPIKASIRRFLAVPSVYGSFDFAYSAGLYDYLEEPVAAALTRSLFASLRPGGLMLVANFAPNLRDIGYMEAIMDWTLIYRDEAAVAQFTSLLAPDEIASQSLFRDSTGNVVYLTIRKRDGVI